MMQVQTLKGRGRLGRTMSRIGSILLRSAVIGVFVALASAALAAENTIVRRFDRGSGLNEVGVVRPTEDAEMTGPQAIYVGPDDKVYLLDQVNDRVLSFDPKRPKAEPRVLKLPKDLRPSDMIVRKNEVLVWDGNIHTFQAKGPQNASVRGLEEESTRGLDDPYAVSAFAQMGSQRPIAEGDVLDDKTRSIGLPGGDLVRQNIASRGLGLLTVDVKPSAKPTEATLEVHPAGRNLLIATLHITVRDRLGSVEFLDADRHGRMFVLVENVPPSSHIIPSAFVVRYTSDGKLDRVYDIPFSANQALTRRFVAISDEGDVYFLRTTQDRVDVIGVGSRPVATNGIIETAGGRREYSHEALHWAVNAAVLPLTRKRVIATAFAFENARWRLSESSYGSDPSKQCTGLNRTRRPAYLNGKVGQEVRGIPYCWGCSGTLASVLKKLKNGVLAGNVCTHQEPLTDVAGVDCSAFISACWGLDSHFTTDAIPAITTELKNPWDLQPGDALNKPGVHVMLFLGFTRDRRVRVMEAATHDCDGRVCQNVYPLSAVLARGFRPVRYRALTNNTFAEATPVGAAEQMKAVAKPAPVEKARAEQTRHHRWTVRRDRRR